MSQETLAILYIKRIISQLEKAVKECDLIMPDDAERIQEKHYIGNSVIPFLDKNKDHWEVKNTGLAIALVPIQELIDEIGEDLDIAIAMIKMSQNRPIIVSDIKPEQNKE